MMTIPAPSTQFGLYGQEGGLSSEQGGVGSAPPVKRSLLCSQPHIRWESAHFSRWISNLFYDTSIQVFHVYIQFSSSQQLLMYSNWWVKLMLKFEPRFSLNPHDHQFHAITDIANDNQTKKALQRFMISNRIITICIQLWVFCTLP